MPRYNCFAVFTRVSYSVRYGINISVVCNFVFPAIPDYGVVSAVPFRAPVFGQVLRFAVHGQAVATVERVSANALNAFGYNYARQANAITKRPFRNAYGIASNSGGRGSRVVVGYDPFADVLYAVFCLYDAVATAERVIAYTDYAVGDSEGSYAFTICERIRSDFRYAVGQVNVLKIVATVKSLPADTCDTVGNGNTPHVTTHKSSSVNRRYGQIIVRGRDNDILAFTVRAVVYGIRIRILMKLERQAVFKRMPYRGVRVVTTRYPERASYQCGQGY